jgi:peroxiredoxin (alkyl hydroperoxide reductase subunit C)
MKKKIFLIAMLFLSLTTLQAQKNDDTKIPLIGSDAPAFTAQTTNGDLNFPSDYGSSWKILFSHPRDFTPVCSSELLELAQMQTDFSDLGVKLAIISTDNLEKHKQWKSALEDIAFQGNQPTKIKYAIIDDHTCSVSKKYGMLHTPVSTTEDVRGVFIIDSKNKVRAIYFYPMNVGRNMDEIKRTVVALQTADKEKLATPANWDPGEDMLVPHYPYTKKELADNPELENMYYSVGSFMWYKKAK